MRTLRIDARRLSLVLAAGIALVLGVAVASFAASPFTEPFMDVEGNVHEGMIYAIAAEGITQGCDVDPARYCPSGEVSRAEIAAFVVRASNEDANLPAYQGYFADVPPGRWYTGAVERLYELGLTAGCDAEPLRYCPDDPVQRNEMAAFLVRFVEDDANLPSYEGYFTDVPTGQWYTPYVERLSDLGITQGCDTEAALYCPFEPVLRDQMASFLGRALGSDPVVPPPPTTPPIRISVLTYNIHHGEGGDGVIDLERIAAVINSVSPDLVSLQEVENGTTRSGGVDQTAALAGLTGMNGVFGHNLDFGGGGFGNAILSRRPITGSSNHSLPSWDAGEPRGVLEATVEVTDGVSIRFLSTHLDYREDSTERLLSVAAINDLVATFAGQSVVLAGDLNARPIDEEIQILASTWLTHTGAELLSHPAVAPDKQLDHVLAAAPSQWRIVSAQVLDDDTASDHRAIYMILELTP